MRFFGLEIGRQPPAPIFVSDDGVKFDARDEAPTIRPELKGVQIPEAKQPAKIIPVSSKVLTYNATNKKRGQFTPAEYNLAEIGKVEDTDSYCSQAHMKKAGLLFKEGFEFVGPNPKTVQYIRLRFQQISRASGIPTEELLKSIGSGLVKKSNVFLYKARKEEASGGKNRILAGTDKEIEPVAAYFIIPAETMMYDADEFGRIRRWKQRLPSGLEKEFRPEDIVHFTFNKKEGMIFGTPILIPVLDDIRALRRIEENIEMLVYQHLFPLFHYKIGTDEHPSTVDEFGNDEIELARREIQYMPSEGGVVTSHRHEIKLIGAENRSLRAEGYLEHFKKRVFAGLGVSAVDMGEGECFDEHTMTLTENGFKFHWQIDHTKEKIATYNPLDRRIEFHLANSKFEDLYHGEMIRFKSETTDLLVTPHHEMWVKIANSTKWQKIFAKDIAAKKYKGRIYMLTGAPYTEENCIPSSERSAKVLSLAGYLAGLGKQRQTDNTLIIGDNCRVSTKDVTSLLDEFEVPYYLEPRTVANRVYIVIKYSDLLNSLDGFFYNMLSLQYALKVIKSVSITDRRAFLLAFMKSYARRALSENNRIVRYHLESLSLSDQDAIQEMGIASGYRVYLATRKDKNSSLGNYLCITADSMSSSTFILPKHVSVERYSGITYCYNVPNHLFVVRRNKKISIQGNTANRSTSDSMSRNLVDSVKDLQRHLESQFTDFVINELLLESTFGPEVLNEENRVHLRFKEIDLDHQIKKETHYADQFAKNVITIHEARTGQGRQTFRIPTPEEVEANPNIAEQYPEWHSTFFKLIEEPKALIQAIDEPYSTAAKAAAANPATAITAKGNEEAAEEQKEQEIALEKEKGKAKVAIAKLKPKPIAKKKDNHLNERFDDLLNDAISIVSKEKIDLDWLQQLARATETVMIEDTISKMMAAFSSGYRSFNNSPDQQIAATIRSRGKLENRANFYIHKLITNTLDALKRQQIDVLQKSDRIQKVKAVFESLRYRTDFIHNVEISKAYNLGILEAAKDRGFKTWKVQVDNNSCDNCKAASLTVYSLDSIAIEDIPPLHANSRSLIEVE